VYYATEACDEAAGSGGSAIGRRLAAASGLRSRAAGSAARTRPRRACGLAPARAIVTAAERVSPAVVSVSVVATRVVRTDPFGGMFHDEFWDRFYPPTAYREKISGLGSGVIVDPEGVVLTNEHVIDQAEQITVTLSDGRQLPAKLLGASPTYDLAVLKIASGKLPVAPLGDSDKLVVGEWAIAIGNPFGYLLTDNQPTVTAGVVSAMHRDVEVRGQRGRHRRLQEHDSDRRRHQSRQQRRPARERRRRGRSASTLHLHAAAADRWASASRSRSTSRGACSTRSRATGACAPRGRACRCSRHAVRARTARVPDARACS
jgi:serine protease Do